MRESQWFWNLIARKYDKHTWKDESFKETVGTLKKYVRADHTVLDYACGTGIVGLQIADAVKKVHAIDISAKMIQLGKDRARERGVTNVRFERKSLFDETIEGSSYDVVLAFNILHLLEDARKAVNRARELLKPEGLLVSSTPCLGDAGTLWRALLPVISRIGILSYLRSFEDAEVKKAHVDEGFEILESRVRGESIPLCLLVARKRNDAGGSA